MIPQPGDPVRSKRRNKYGDKRVLWILATKANGRWVLGTLRQVPVVLNANPAHWEVVERIELRKAA